MSPILVRPVREQLEHDRVIRLLQAKYKRKFEVAINPGNEQTMPVGAGPSPWYPDLVLQTADRGHKLAGVVEVETTESVNNLEATSQWATFARLRVPFHLYLPTGCVDSARRFCTDLNIPVAELWAYQSVGDQLRFTLVQRAPQASDGKSRASEDLAVESRPHASAAGRPATPDAPKSHSTSKRATPRARTNGQPASRPGRSASQAAPVRRPAAKSKPAAPAPRRAAAKAPVRRKTKSAASSSRAQKRR